MGVKAVVGLKDEERRGAGVHCVQQRRVTETGRSTERRDTAGARTEVSLDSAGRSLSRASRSYSDQFSGLCSTIHCSLSC